jgi:DNA-binding CsgD family transcriptional regulator
MDSQIMTARGAALRIPVRSALVVVDATYRVLFRERDAPWAELTEGTIAETGRLPPAIEAAVRKLTADWPARATRNVSALTSRALVTVIPLAGELEPCFGVLIEEVRERDGLRRAAERYGLSDRERDVLLLSMRGLSGEEIAACLDIAESTVSDYYRRLLAKTRSKHRAQLVAKVLDFDVNADDHASPRRKKTAKSLQHRDDSRRDTAV